MKKPHCMCHCLGAHFPTYFGFPHLLKQPNLAAGRLASESFQALYQKLCGKFYHGTAAAQGHSVARRPEQSLNVFSKQGGVSISLECLLCECCCLRRTLSHPVQLGVPGDGTLLTEVLLCLVVHSPQKLTKV